MPEYSPYQKKIIDRYYDRRDQIMLTRLGEIVSDLYLADSDAKIISLWTRAGKAMQALKVPPALLAHILNERKPELLARHLRRWQEGTRPEQDSTKS